MEGGKILNHYILTILSKVHTPDIIILDYACRHPWSLSVRINVLCNTTQKSYFFNKIFVILQSESIVVEDRDELSLSTFTSVSSMA